MDTPTQNPPSPPYSAHPSPKLVRRTYQSGLLRLCLDSFAKDPTATPIFVQGGSISGSVQIPQTESVTEISTRVVCFQQGLATPNHTTRDTMILDLPHRLWPATSSSRLQEGGDYIWPFSFTLPPTVRRGTAGSDYLLPPSFSHPGFSDFIRYKLLIVVRRKGLMKLDIPIEASFVYTIHSIPSRPTSRSILAAYEQESVIPSPETDPTAYESTMIPIKGRIFDQMTVDMTCELSLPGPTEYPIGTPLHLFLGFRCCSPLADPTMESQALDLMTTPLSIRVTLRCLYFLKQNDTRSKSVHRSEEVAQAVLWRIPPSNRDVDGTSRCRELQGEIQVPSHLSPSFAFPTLSVRYTVSLVISAPGFRSDSGTPATTFCKSVRLTYGSCPGVPKTLSYAPAPTYNDVLTAPRKGLGKRSTKRQGLDGFVWYQ